MTRLNRLRGFIRGHVHGGCKILSVGDKCECPLCDLDFIISEESLRSEILNWPREKQLAFCLHILGDEAQAR